MHILEPLRSMSLKFARLFSSRLASLGAWSELNSRAPSLKIRDDGIREGIFNGIPSSGPCSITNEEQRDAYHSPVAIDEAFAGAYKVLEADSLRIYRKIDAQRAKMTPKQLEHNKMAAERYNPEVLYNAHFDKDCVDRSHPVYRKFLQEKWESYDLMVTMQRLEQHHVIPDTLPTLEPRVDVRVKFGHNIDPDFSDWVVPGTKLPAFAASRPPTIEVQEFESVENSLGLYSVLLVNPDVPDLEKNSFKTSLNYGLYNVLLTFTDNTISPGKLLRNPEYVFEKYVPLTPEKNAPVQRACLWVFRQKTALQNVEYDSQNFDIRAFTDANELYAVGAHVWRQEFDRSVGKVRQEYGLPKGRVFDPVRGDQPLL